MLAQRTMMDLRAAILCRFKKCHRCQLKTYSNIAYEQKPRLCKLRSESRYPEISILLIDETYVVFVSFQLILDYKCICPKRILRINFFFANTGIVQQYAPSNDLLGWYCKLTPVLTPVS